MNASTKAQTLLSSIQTLRGKINVDDALPARAAHQFSTSSQDSCALLQDLIQTTHELSHSLNSYMANPISNPKLVSLLRQQSSISSSLYAVNRNTHQTIDALRKRPYTNYGEDVPLDRGIIVEWCIARLETWANSLGMETFKDEGREGGISVVLGGKILVVDVDFSVDRKDAQNPVIGVTSVKTSYAVPNSTSGSASTTDGSVSLDGLLAFTLRGFCLEAQKPEDTQDPREAARIGSLVQEQLKYLVMLDKLAARIEDGGIRWFVDVDELCAIAENFSKTEAELVASSLSLASASLDVFLLRSHALPLPYLISPSITFLTYLSPLAYLSLLRASANSGTAQEHNSNLPDLDISISTLRSYLSSHPCPRGATIATLLLSPIDRPQGSHESMSMPGLATRPTFPLVPDGATINHIFPQLTDPLSDPSSGQYAWMLDFTQGGKYRGVVMSQSRMRDIELVVNPLGDIDHMNSVGMMSFGTGSWVDLLINPSSHSSPERYTAIYRSPTSAHPPLQLRLSAPEEPGFFLERVRVHTIKEVWGILEVVREQCWLNEILDSCHWSTEGLTMDEDRLPQDDEATEEDLQAALNGTLIPCKIPVSVYLPSSSISHESLFDPDVLTIPHAVPRRPRIVMASPERPPISGLVEITVTYDETQPRGINVQISGAMGTDLKTDTLEEICRRGGTLGLSGRVWANTHANS